MSNWNMRIRAAREAQKMTRKMVVQKMQQFLPESEKAVTTRALMSWEAGEREPALPWVWRWQRLWGLRMWQFCIWIPNPS
ncbi:hypothetical protein NIA69_20350 [Gemmiger formicilis]|nr:hypothetical protein [Gemmiger formicilis]